MPPDLLALNLALFALGFLVIIRGSDLFLDSAVWMAKAAGVSQVIIGATIVSVCTTLPELIASLTAALKGSGDMALGNAVGSVICNTGLILGATLLCVTVRILREVFLVKGVFMVGALLATFFLLAGGASGTAFTLGRSAGAVLLVLLVIYMVVNYYESIHGGALPVDADAVPAEPAIRRREWRKHLLTFCVGALAVALGAFLLIEFGQRLARNLGVGEAIISLVFVALGTSLPELFTAISAVRKGAQDISIGNVFGANVLNLAMVVGASATVQPLTVRDPLLVYFDIPMALGLCACALGAGLLRGRVGRRTGLLLLGVYGAYLLAMAVRMGLGK